MAESRSTSSGRRASTGRRAASKGVPDAESAALSAEYWLQSATSREIREEVQRRLKEHKYKSWSGAKRVEDAAKQAEEILWIGGDVAAELAKGEAIAQGVNYARDLGNLPGNICTPSYLAEQAEVLAANDQIETIIIDEASVCKKVSTYPSTKK